MPPEALCVVLLTLLAPPEPGPLVGLASDGVYNGATGTVYQLRPEVAGPRLFDYTFGTAPTDWLPSAGIWEVTNRYACDPTWSFYGGHSRGLACLWNKHRFGGDILFEVYAAFTYGLKYTETVWLERPSDLCLTICGDGESPASGYSFVFGAEDSRRTAILRAGETLAATDDPRFLPPSFSDRRPEREEMHWRWWRLEARRHDGRLEFWIDGRKALEAPEPAPLEGGRVAIWTVHNGIVVSRARIAASEVLDPNEAAVRVNEPAPLPVPDGDADAR